jgi:hypothetical protein
LCILSAPNSSAAIDSVSSLDLVAVPDPTIACTAGHEVDLAECRLYAAGSIAASFGGSYNWSDRPSGCSQQNERVFFNEQNASSTCSPDIDSRPGMYAEHNKAECELYAKLCFAAPRELLEVPWVSTIHECGNGRSASHAQCMDYAAREGRAAVVFGTTYIRPLGCFR